MKRKCINTLVAALTIMTITTTSALPAFAEPYDNQEVTSAVSENNNLQVVYCDYCHSKLPPNSTKCEHCGASIRQNKN